LTSVELPRFALEIRPDRSRVVLAIRGEVDLASARDIPAALEELRGTGWDDIVIDMRDVTFIDSTGLAVLIAADERARREGWRLAVAEGCPPLDRLLDLTCLSSRLTRA
jgi:anti-anti-sigma factor